VIRATLIGSALAIALSACAGGASDAEQPADLEFAPVGALPASVRQAPTAVRDAYRFTLANSDVLRQVPCHCGCGSMGHTSNAACYLSPDSTADGPVFDSHALGCSICVDITQDVMRLMRQGKDLAEIKAYVETTYSRYGPSNLP
jgi:hypothetical protein